MKLIIEIEDEHSHLIFNSLKYETAPRAKINFSMKEKKLIMEMETDSISNLRAACNSFLKWIDMIKNIAYLMNK